MSSVRVSVSRGFMPAVGSSSSRSRGLGGERARDLEASLVAVGEVLGQLVLLVAQAHEGEQLARAARAPGASSAHDGGRPEDRAGHRGAEAAVLADQDVVEHGHVLEEPDRLERARDPAPDDGVGPEPDEAAPVEEDLARGPAGAGR